MANLDLFGNSVPTLPNLVLEEPTADQWNAIKDFLESRCTKNQLLDYANAFQLWFNDYGKVMRATRDGRIFEASEATMMMKSNTSKQGIAQGIALILASDQNLSMYVDTMSDELKELWRTVLFKVYVTQEEAKKILKTSNNLFKKERSYYYYSDSRIVWNKREYAWFKVESFRSEKVGNYGYRDYEGYITVLPAVRALLSHHQLRGRQPGPLSVVQRTLPARRLPAEKEGSGHGRPEARTEEDGHDRVLPRRHYRL